jgi:hypothetical protein
MVCLRNPHREVRCCITFSNGPMVMDLYRYFLHNSVYNRNTFPAEIDVILSHLSLKGLANQRGSGGAKFEDEYVFATFQIVSCAIFRPLVLDFLLLYCDICSPNH